MCVCVCVCMCELLIKDVNGLAFCPYRVGLQGIVYIPFKLKSHGEPTELFVARMLGYTRSPTDTCTCALDLPAPVCRQFFFFFFLTRVKIDCHVPDMCLPCVIVPVRVHVHSDCGDATRAVEAGDPATGPG